MDFRGPGKKSILTEVHLIWGFTKWARSLDFDRPTALSDSLYQSNNELKPVIRFENAEHCFKLKYSSTNYRKKNQPITITRTVITYGDFPGK